MSESKLSVRVNSANLNHHLWNNNGTWFVHYTRHEPGFIKRRIRASLKTQQISVARSRRDALILCGGNQRAAGGGGNGVVGCESQSVME